MKKIKTKLFMSLSVLIIGFLISVLSLNIVSTQALLKEEYNQYTIDSFDRSAWYWTTTEVVSTDSTGESDRPSLATDSVGTVHIAWQDVTDYDGSEADMDIFYKRWDSSSSAWTTTEVVSTESTGHSYNPSLAVDTLGNVHIAWQDATDYAGAGGTEPDIFYKRWDSSSSAWTTTEVVSTESTDESYYPSLAIDSAENVHIAWYDWIDFDSRDVFYKRWDSSSSAWTTTEVVSTESTGNSYNPSLATDVAGNVHIGWYDETNYDSSGTDNDIFYKCWNDSISTWTTTEVVSTESTGHSYRPSLATDATGTIHITWYDWTDYDGAGGTEPDIFYKRWDVSTSVWTTTEVVSTESTGHSYIPSLVVDDEENVYIGWYDGTNYEGSGTDMDIFYNRWDDSTSTWSTTEVVSTESTGTSFLPSLAIDSAGTVHVAWADYTNYLGIGTDLDIFYKRLEMMGSLAAPELAYIVPNPDEDGLISLDWNDVSRALKYYIYRSPSYIWTVEGISPIDETTSSWYIDTVVSDGYYYYTIVAENSTSNSTHSNCEYVEVQLPDFSSPELAFIAPNPSKTGVINLDWNDITGATEYYVYRSSDYIWSIQGLTPITTVIPSDYVDTLPFEGSYYYAITANDGSSNSSHSNCQYVEVKFTDLEAPTFIPILPNPTEVNSIVLDWTDVDGVVEYYIYRSNSFIENLDGLTPHMTVVSDSFAGDTLPSAGIYFYVVVASDGTSNSSHSNCQYIEVKFPDLEAPELSPILPNPTDITSVSLVWDSIDGAIEYYIYRSTSYIWSVEGLTPIAAVVITSYVDTLPSEGIYLYVIVANDGLRNSTHSNCEYVEYKLPTLNEFFITFGILGGAAVILITTINLRKRKNERIS